MNTNQQLFFKENRDELGTEEEIDLKQFYNFLLRNTKLIGIFASLGLFISCLIAFNTKRVWQGEFQIVLEGSSSSSLPSVNQRIARIVGITPEANSLETEIGILKSPSVLMNVFEFVKTNKSEKTNSSMQGLRFKKWRKDSLDIILEKGTTILNLAYKDTDKDLILPVLNNISSTYQGFAEKKRIRSLELGLDYFKEQISVYKNKSILSLSKAQKFATDNDLVIIQDESTINSTGNPANIETIRVKAANQIRIIDQQLVQISNLKDKSDDQIIYSASTIPEMLDLSNKLKDIDTKLARLRVIYKDNDKTIQKSIKERAFLIDLLKKQVVGFLKARKADAQARMKAAERPEIVLIEYKMLLSNALKDQSTLDDLESQNRLLLLEKARSKEPWKLITNPTLLPYPVAPSRKKILALGLFCGIFLGTGVAMISEKRKNIIYSISELEALGQWNFIVELSGNQKKYWDKSLNLLVTNQLLDVNGSIALIAIGEINNSLLEELYKSLKDLLGNCELIVTKDLLESNKFTNLIVLTAYGITRRDELLDTNIKLLLQKESVLGLLTLNNIN